MIAIAYMFTMSLATIRLADASRNKCHVKEDVVVWCHNIMKYNAAEWFLSIILKHAAAKSQNTMMFAKQNAAKNGFATNIADMYQDIIGNMFAEIQVATLLIHQLLLAQQTSNYSLNS